MVVSVAIDFASFFGSWSASGAVSRLHVTIGKLKTSLTTPVTIAVVAVAVVADVVDDNERKHRHSNKKIQIIERMMFRVSPDNVLKCNDLMMRCVVGRNGIVDATEKVEGDGCTPAGKWSIRQVFYRSDRFAFANAEIGLKAKHIEPDHGWCDDPNDEKYNKFVKLPYTASCESLWRDDHRYDCVVVLGYNDSPVIRGKGSAIFLHIADECWRKTAGCVALSKEDLQSLLSVAKIGDFIEIVE